MNISKDLYVAVNNHQINEIKDTVYNMAGYRVPYHYHVKGFETFFIKSGSIEVILNGGRFVMEEGDILTFEPFCPHEFKVMAAGTVIREMYTAFENVDNYYELPDPVDIKDSAKEDIRYVTCKEKGQHIFEHEGIRFLQKTARYQLGGHREIWEYQIDKNYKLSFNDTSCEDKVYFVKNGRFLVEMNGERYFADERSRELINIPANTSFSITALNDGCVLHDYNVKAHLFRLLEMLEAAQDYFQEKLEDEEYIRYLFDVNKLYDFIDFKKAESC